MYNARKKVHQYWAWEGTHHGRLKSSKTQTERDREKTFWLCRENGLEGSAALIPSYKFQYITQAIITVLNLQLNPVCFTINFKFIAQQAKSYVRVPAGIRWGRGVVYKFRKSYWKTSIFEILDCINSKVMLENLDLVLNSSNYIQTTKLRKIVERVSFWQKSSKNREFSFARAIGARETIWYRLVGYTPLKMHIFTASARESLKIMDCVKN